MRKSGPTLRTVAGGVPMDAPETSNEARLLDRAADYKSSARSYNTKRGYASDWKHFSRWCAAHKRQALPADPLTIDLYLVACAEGADGDEPLKPSTLARRLVAISQKHKSEGYQPATVAEAVHDTMQGIRREQGVAKRKAAPITLERLTLIVGGIQGEGLKDKRDRAMFLVGYAGAWRESELLGIRVGDVRAVPEGLIVSLPRSKTDQMGMGRMVAIPYGKDAKMCPVKAYQEWLKESRIKTGFVFRPVDKYGNMERKQALTCRAWNYIIKARVAAVGLDKTLFSSHSLRGGLISDAGNAGVSVEDIMLTTGHRTEKQVREYMQEAKLFRNNAATKAGL